MSNQSQLELLAPIHDLDATRWLLADLHDDLRGKVGRFRQLADMSAELGAYRSMIPGGETSFSAWAEARSSFVHGNYVATVLLCQALAENMLAAHLATGLEPVDLPQRISFSETLNRCVADNVMTLAEAEDFRRLLRLRNPLSHYRDINDPSNVSRRAIDEGIPAEHHLLKDATFAMSIAIRLLALPSFKLS